MQTTEAQRRRRLWIEQGNKPCAHPELDREYYLGAQGDLVCTTCGTPFVSRAEAEQDRQQQRERLAREETQTEEVQAATRQSRDQDALKTVEDGTVAALMRACCDAPVPAQKGAVLAWDKRTGLPLEW